MVFPDSPRFVVNSHSTRNKPNDGSSPGSNIWLVSALGGAPRKLRDHAVAYSVSPDGTLIGFGTNKGKFGDREIWLIDSTGKNAQKLFETDEQSSLAGLIWSSDEKRVLYVKTDLAGDTLMSRDLQGGSPLAIFGPAEMKQIRGIFWQADGRLLYSMEEAGSSFGTACNFWGMVLDTHTGKPLEKPRKLTNWSGFCMSGLSVTSDGKPLAFLKWSQRQTSFLAELAPGGTTLLRPKHFPLSESSEFPVEWMPDSKAIFFVSNRSGHNGIYRQSLDQDIAEPVLLEGYGWNPRLTPDGKSILYLGPTENGAPPGKGPEPVMQISIAGGPSRQLFIAKRWSLLACPRSLQSSCVIGEPSEDGKQLVVTAIDSLKGRGPELFRFPLVANDDSWCIDLSPDGTRVAVMRTAESPIYILSLRGKVLRQFQVKG